jgi:hypothetical protein
MSPNSGAFSLASFGNSQQTFSSLLLAVQHSKHFFLSVLCFALKLVDGPASFKSEVDFRTGVFASLRLTSFS